MAARATVQSSPVSAAGRATVQSSADAIPDWRLQCTDVKTQSRERGSGRRTSGAVLVVLALSAPAQGQAPAAGATVFEGARLIVGDGRPPVENATFVVTGTRFVQVGAAGQVSVPAGAARVNLAGKTVMPAIIDTHTHLSQTREALIEDLRRRPVLRRQRGDEPGAGRRAICPSRCAPSREHARRRALLHRRTRHHRAGTGTDDGAVLDHHAAPKPAKPCRNSPPRKSTSSRSGSTTGWASSRS